MLLEDAVNTELNLVTTVLAKAPSLLLYIFLSKPHRTAIKRDVPNVTNMTATVTTTFCHKGGPHGDDVPMPAASTKDPHGKKCLERQAVRLPSSVEIRFHGVGISRNRLIWRLYVRERGKACQRI